MTDDSHEEHIHVHVEAVDANEIVKSIRGFNWGRTMTKDQTKITDIRWRPIATAPKDGRAIVGFYPAWGPVILMKWVTGEKVDYELVEGNIYRRVERQVGEWSVMTEYSSLAIKWMSPAFPTHWMPLPEHPTSEPNPVDDQRNVPGVVEPWEPQRSQVCRLRHPQHGTHAFLWKLQSGPGTFGAVGVWKFIINVLPDYDTMTPAWAWENGWRFVDELRTPAPEWPPTVHHVTAAPKRCEPPPKRSQEARENMRRAHVGKPLSAEHRKAILDGKARAAEQRTRQQ